MSGRSLDGYSRYGKIVIIEHGGGVKTIYAHNKKNLVRAGECVKAGEIIAEVGSSGDATGPHLHFEIRKNGKPVDPLRYLPNNLYTGNLRNANEQITNNHLSDIRRD